MAIGQVKTENITGCRGVLLGSFFQAELFKRSFRVWRIGSRGWW